MPIDLALPMSKHTWIQHRQYQPHKRQVVVFTQHTHCHTSCTTIVLFQRVPTLNSHSINLIGFNPPFHSHAKLCLKHQLVTVFFRNYCITLNLFKFLQQFHICILNLTGSTEYFRKIDWNDCNTTLLQQFSLARTV